MFSISHSWLYKTNPSFLCLQLSAFTKHHLLVVMDYIFPPAVDIILPFQIGPRVYFWLSRDYSVSCYCCDIAKDHGFAVIMYQYAHCAMHIFTPILHIWSNRPQDSERFLSRFSKSLPMMKALWYTAPPIGGAGGEPTAKTSSN